MRSRPSTPTPYLDPTPRTRHNSPPPALRVLQPWTVSMKPLAPVEFPCLPATNPPHDPPAASLKSISPITIRRPSIRRPPLHACYRCLLALEPFCNLASPSLLRRRAIGLVDSAGRRPSPVIEQRHIPSDPDCLRDTWCLQSLFGSFGSRCSALSNAPTLTCQSRALLEISR